MVFNEQSMLCFPINIETGNQFVFHIIIICVCVCVCETRQSRRIGAACWHETQAPDTNNFLFALSFFG